MSSISSIYIYNYITPFCTYLLYCHVIWSGSCDLYLNRILLSQQRVVRIITSSSYLQHTNLILIDLNILRVKDLYFYSCCMLAHKRKKQIYKCEKYVEKKECQRLEYLVSNTIHHAMISLP